MSNPKPWFSWQELDQAAVLLLESKPERRKELKSIGDRLNQLAEDEVKNSKMYYPVRFLTDGVAAYYEAFDNGAVFYAALSMELALDIRLWENRKAFDQPQVLQNSNAIDEAAKIGVLPIESVCIAHNLR